MSREHRLLAAFYDQGMAPLEKVALSARRDRLAACVSGRVLEIGSGTGINLSHYGPLDLLVASEPDRAMIRKLVEKKEALRSGVIPIFADCQELPFEEESFDAVVSTLVLCSVKLIFDTLKS